MPILPTTPQALIEAMGRFNTQLRDTPEWGGLGTKQSSRLERCEETTQLPSKDGLGRAMKVSVPPPPPPRPSARADRGPVWEQQYALGEPEPDYSIALKADPKDTLQPSHLRPL
jgi:hypothetical protein